MPTEPPHLKYKGKYSFKDSFNPNDNANSLKTRPFYPCTQTLMSFTLLSFFSLTHHVELMVFYCNVLIYQLKVFVKFF